MNQHTSPRLRGRIALLTLALILAACGGGGGASAPAAGGGTPGGSTTPPAATGPAIVTQPVSQAVVAGQAVTFSVAAADGTATGYQWQRDGKDIPGATGLTYTLADPQAADSGARFAAVVTGAGGKTTSSAAVLGVSVPKGLAVVAGTPDASGSATNVDGNGTAARFSLADVRGYDTHYELATDAQGNVHVGETDRVRKVTPAGTVATLPLAPGNYTTSYYPSSVAVDGSVLAVSNGVVSRIDAAGVSHFIAGQAGVKGVADGVGAKASFTTPQRLLEDGQGNIWLIDTVPGPMVDVDVKHNLRKIAPDGTVTTLYDSKQTLGVALWYLGKEGKQWSVDADGNIVRTDPDGTRTIVRRPHDVGDRVSALTVDGGGNLYLAMRDGADLAYVSKITPAGVETVIAGSPGGLGVRDGTPGRLGVVDAITVAPDGTVYVMSENALVRILQ